LLGPSGPNLYCWMCIQIIFPSPLT
jgi:hypothetical protein